MKKRTRTPHEIEMRRLLKEGRLIKKARASVSLDGCTQSCDACTLERTAGPHRCGRREMTAAECRLIDKILSWPEHRFDEDVKAVINERENARRK